MLCARICIVPVLSFVITCQLSHIEYPSDFLDDDDGDKVEEEREGEEGEVMRERQVYVRIHDQYMNPIQ